MTHQRIGARRVIGAAGSLVFGLTLLYLARSFVLAQTDIFHIPAFTLLDVAYSPNSVYVAYVYADGRLEVVNSITNDIVLKDKPQLSYSLLKARVDWSPTANILAAGIGTQVFIWDIGNVQLLQTIFVGDDSDLVSREGDYFVSEGINSLQWSSTGSLLLAQSLSSRYTIWSLQAQDFIFDEFIGNNPVPVVWLTDNRSISNSHTVVDVFTRIRSNLQGEIIPWVNNTCGSTVALTNSGDHLYMIAGTGNGCVVLIDASTGDQRAAFKIAGNGIPVWDVSWSPDSHKLVAVTEQGSVHVIDVATGSFVIAAQIDTALYAVDWASDNSAITYGSHTTNGTALATINVAEVTALMNSDAVQQPEFSSTPEASESDK